MDIPQISTLYTITQENALILSNNEFPHSLSGMVCQVNFTALFLVGETGWWWLVFVPPNNVRVYYTLKPR